MRHIIITATAAALIVGALLFTDASAWKCDKHPEQPTCTTLPPESTTSTSTSAPPEVPPSSSTSTSVPVELAPPVSVVRPPVPPRFAG